MSQQVNKRDSRENDTGTGDIPGGNSLWVAVFLAITGMLVAQWMGVTTAFAALIVATLLSLYTYRKIGGYTGDTLGAVCEIAEIVPALVAVCWGNVL